MFGDCFNFKKILLLLWNRSKRDNVSGFDKNFVILKLKIQHLFGDRPWLMIMPRNKISIFPMKASRITIAQTSSADKIKVMLMLFLNFMPLCINKYAP